LETLFCWTGDAYEVAATNDHAERFKKSHADTEEAE
jgi:hypothetical protein